MDRIETKGKLVDNYKFFYWTLKLKGEINLTKEFKKIIIKIMRTKLKKNNISQIRIERWNWKQIDILQKDQKQKLKIKRIRTEIEILINKEATLKFCTANTNFKGISKDLIELISKIILN